MTTSSIWALPWLRSTDWPLECGYNAGDGWRENSALPVVDHDFLDSFSLDIETKQSRYLLLLRELPAGLSEWAVHPEAR